MIPLSDLIPVFLNCPVLNTHHPLESLHDKHGAGCCDMAQQVKAFVECLCSIPEMHTVKGQSLANYKMGDIRPNRSQSALCVGHGVLGLRPCPPHSRGPRSLTPPYNRASCMLVYMQCA